MATDVFTTEHAHVTAVSRTTWNKLSSLFANRYHQMYYS